MKVYTLTLAFKDKYEAYGFKRALAEEAGLEQSKNPEFKIPYGISGMDEHEVDIDETLVRAVESLRNLNTLSTENTDRLNGFIERMDGYIAIKERHDYLNRE
jgi:hypothetical protein